MKKIIIAALCLSTTSVSAQIKTPQASPPAQVTQTIGLTEVEINYSRPLKRDRVIFGELVPYNEIWRTGANKNTTISTSDILIFGKDTLHAGTYAIFTMPVKDGPWKVMFYSNSDNWGTPDEWKEELVALSVEAPLKKMNEVTESFTIAFDAVDQNGATLSLSWDKTKVLLPFSVPTKEKVLKSIENMMSGPSADDYYRAADYYLAEKKELDKALTWMNKAIELRGDEAFWMLRKKALIQAELKDYKGAIETAKRSLEAAKKANYESYVKSNEASIEEWSKEL